MAVALRGISSRVSGSGATISLTQDVPGLANGDYMLMVVYANNVPATPPIVDAGWTLIDAEASGNSYLHVYGKIAASEPGSYTISRNTGNKTYAAGIIAFYSDDAQDLYVDANANQFNTPTSNNRTCPSVTTTKASAGLACFFHAGANGSSAPPGDMTEQWDELVSSALRIYAMTAILSVAGATGDKVCTGIITMTSRAVTVAIAEQPAAPDVLDASLVTFFRVQAAKQTTFDDPATPTFALPVVFDYQQGDIEQLAAWDPGVWTPLTIVEQVAKFATFTLRGALFFELLPVFLNAGFGEMTPSGIGPYTYADSVAPGAVGAPAAYTFRFGGNDANSPQASMVQVQDAYLHKLVLSFNLNDKAVTFESEWFGRFVDDNNGAGYAPEAVPLPPGLVMVNGLLSSLGIQDATSTGGAFDALTEFECSLIEWQLVIDTGLRPAWAGDGNALTYCGVRQEWPSATFAAHLRTNLSNYAVTKVKANLHQHQELQLGFYGVNREFVLEMTGRWLPKFAAHDRSREEVVLKPTFQVETPATQTTTPHWLSYSIEAGWSH